MKEYTESAAFMLWAIACIAMFTALLAFGLWSFDTWSTAVLGYAAVKIAWYALAHIFG